MKNHPEAVNRNNVSQYALPQTNQVIASVKETNVECIARTAQLQMLDDVLAQERCYSRSFAKNTHKPYWVS